MKGFSLYLQSKNKLLDYLEKYNLYDDEFKYLINILDKKINL
jgi:hypothetical protein